MKTYKIWIDSTHIVKVEGSCIIFNSESKSFEIYDGDSKLSDLRAIISNALMIGIEDLEREDLL